MSKAGDFSAERVVPTICSNHCGGTCRVNAHVKDGVITRIEGDDLPENQLRGCLKGRAYRQRVYAPDRLRYPLKRTGPRGESKFERISWDEALDTVAAELIRVRDTYGPAAIIHWGSGGGLGMLNSQKWRMERLLGLIGGYTRPWGIHSFEGGIFAELATYGTTLTGSSRDNLLNSRLIILWGWNPAVTIAETNTSHVLIQAKEAGARIVSIDPRYTETTAALDSRWIPIRPCTDAAMLVAMAHVMLTQNLQDQAFLNQHTLGFDAFRDYVLGIEDGIAKTPAWAEDITGVPAATIKELAEDYATTKPAALMTGIAPGRTAFGEQYHRVALTLAAMTGNIGLPGGSSGCLVLGAMPEYWKDLRMRSGIKVPPNPTEETMPSPKDKIPRRKRAIYGLGSINVFSLPEAILQGKSGGYPADYKLMYLSTSNIVNQWPNTNKTIQALNKLEFIVVEEQFMTATARYADIVLPTNTFYERNDIVLGGDPPFFGYQNKVIESLHESKSEYDITRELAARMGIADYGDKPAEEMLDAAIQDSSVPDPDDFKRKAIFRPDVALPSVAFSNQISDPENNPFPTPSGKIEIYSQELADMGNPLMPPIPKYVEAWEGPKDPLAAKYPLQLVTTHSKRRAHSQFDTIPWLREVELQAAEINALDAEARGIKDGDTVMVFNDRGRMVIPAKVTERIMPGVVNVPQGAWHNPDENGVDRGGCANILTKDQASPGRAMPSNTALVQVEKYRQ